MADKEVEEWAAKSKAIEAERMKAAKAIVEEKLDRTNEAFLDPKLTKVKGYSKDTDVILASAERIGNRALVLVICGLLLAFVARMGGYLVSVFRLGLFGMMFEILSAAAAFLLGLGFIMGLVTIGFGLYYKCREGRRLTMAFWTALGAVGIVVVLVVVSMLVFRFI